MAPASSFMQFAIKWVSGGFGMVRRIDALKLAID